MADQIDRRPGGGGAIADSVLYKDRGDGSWSETTNAETAAWNGTSLAWEKLTLDNGTGGLNVQIVGGSSAGTEYTEDAAAPANPAGIAQALVRLDAPAGLTTGDNDIVMRRGTDYGAAYTQIVSSTGSLIDSFGGGTAYSEDAATPATIVGTAGMLERDDIIATLTPVEGDWVGMRASAEGALWTQDFNSDAILADTTAILADTAAMDTNLATLAGAVTGTEMQVDIVSGAGGVEYTEDVATANPIVGSATMMERDDIIATLTPVEGDWVSLRSSAEGALWTQDFNSDAILADTTAIKTAVEILDNAIAGTEMQVDVLTMPTTAVTGTFWQATQPVSAVSLPLPSGAATEATLAGTLTVASHAVTNAGTFATQVDGAALTALQLIDDIVFTDDTSVHATGATKGAGVMAAATPTDAAVAANDIGMLAMSLDRRLHVDADITAAVALDVSAATVPVSGTFWQGTQPVSAASLPLPSGAATEATLAGTLTVGSHAVTNAGTFATQIDGAALTALQLIDDPVATISATPLQRVAIFDAADAQITTFGGGTEYTEDISAPADPLGNAQMLVRLDTPGALTTTDDDWVARRGTNYGAAYTQIVDSSGSFVDTFGGGTQYTEAATDATITGTVAMMEVAADTLQPIQGTVADGLLVNLGSQNDVTVASGTITAVTDITNVVSVDDNAGSLTVDGTFWQATQPVSGTVTVTHPALGTGTEAGAQRVTIATDSTGVLSIDDNAGSLTVDGTVTVTHPQLGAGTESGAQRVTIATDSTGVLSIDDNAGTLTVDNATLTTLATQLVAHDAADAGNPLKIGMKAVAMSASPTEVATSDRTDWLAQRNGVPYVIGGHPNVQAFEYNTTAAQTNDPIINTIAAGTVIVLTSIEATVDNATTVDVGLRVGFGSATLTAEGASGADAVTNIVLSHPGLAAGSGMTKGNGGGIIGVGATGAELRVTNDVPTTGKLRVTGTYYTASI